MFHIFKLVDCNLPLDSDNKTDLIETCVGFESFLVIAYRTSKIESRPDDTLYKTFEAYKLKHAYLTRPFIEEATQKGQSKERCMCIKQ